MLFKKLSMLAMVGILSVSIMTGCTSVEDTEGTKGNIQIEMQFGKVLEYQINDGIAVVKAEIENNGNAEHMVQKNFYNIASLVEQVSDTELSQIKELQYWSVAKNDEGKYVKIFSCTMPQESLQLIKNKKVMPNDIGNMTSKCTDLWIIEQFANLPEIVWPSKTESNENTSENKDESQDSNTKEQTNKKANNNDKNQSNGSSVKDNYNQGIKDALDGKEPNPPKDNNNSNYNPEADHNGDGKNDHYDDYDDSPNEYIEEGNTPAPQSNEEPQNNL